MSVFWAKRVGNAIHPDGVESCAEVAKMPIGKLLLVEVKRPRSGPQHRLFWELVRRVGTATGVEPENLADLLKIETGHCEIIHSKKYGELRLPRSISFAAMSQDDFSVFLDKCIDVLCNNWGLKKPDILAAIEDVLVPTEDRG